MISLGNRLRCVGSMYGEYYYSTYPKFLIKDSSVKIESLDDKMLPVLEALTSLGERHNLTFVITSGNDSDKHCANSLHYKNRAIDISMRNGYSGIGIPTLNKGGSLFIELRKLLCPHYPLYQDFDVIAEGDHIHIEYDPSSNKTRNESNGNTNGVTDTQVQRNPQETWIGYCHADPTIKTLDELISLGLSIFSKFKSAKELGAVKNPKVGKTNRQLIESKYGKVGDQIDGEFPTIKVGTVIYVKSNELERDFLSVESVGQVVDFNGLNTYFTKTQEELDKSLKKGEYVPAYDFLSAKYGSSELVKYVNSFFRVWIYSKTLDRVCDVTRFCYDVSTQTSLGGGDTFSLKLAYVGEGLQSSLSSIYNISENVYLTNPFDEISFFIKNVSDNDIVFISYETLNLEKDRLIGNKVGKEDFFVPNDNLGDQYYDFIGLVSGIQQSVTAQGMGSVSINGASLEKLFTDDEAVFKPIAVMEDSFSGNLMLGDRKKRGWMSRFFASGEYMNILTMQYRTIETTMKFFMNLVSNVGFLPLSDSGQNNTDLFRSYRRILEDGSVVDDRSYLFNITDNTVSSELARGIYQIVKLSVDPQLSKRKLSDSNVANPQGSVMSLFRTCCNPNLTELVMDTFKNTFDVICRVPPFTKSAIESYRDKFFEIDANNVREENLSWETDFYTWFELQPKGNIVPVDTNEALCYIPILFLNEYIDLWGSKCLSVVSPYGIGVGSEEVAQSVNDLCWLVESSFYLPFTRKGTIVLSVGDRRIRKGMWIKYPKTGEIFYVNSVSQSASITIDGVQRQTVLTVSRGLVEKYVFSSNGDDYFSIMDFKALSDKLKGLMSENYKDSELTMPMVVNKDLFRFYCQRKQFEG